MLTTMMMRMRARIAAAVMIGAIALSGSGCATILGTALSEGAEPYAGTRVDAEVMGKGYAPVLAAVDMPFSFAADTALLPVTLPGWCLKHGHSR